MGRLGEAGLYVHVPFCRTRCVYCDFASEACAAVPDDFVEWVLREAEAWARCGESVRGPTGRAPFGGFDTLYLGGGTPSLLPEAAWRRLVSGLRARLPLAGLREVTAEVNPDDVRPALLEAMATAGVNRISLGVQSLRDEDLRWLGRRHDAAGALAAARAILDQGFSLAVDLIYGLPHLSSSGWRETLGQAVELGPVHLSCYELTVEPGTPLGARRAAGERVRAGEDVGCEQFLLAGEILGAAGFEQYEVSNYARGTQHRSLHNQKYWDHRPYLGLGPAAHSFAGRRRWWNHPRIDAYRAALERTGRGTLAEETLNGDQLRLERVLLGLRRSDGLPESFLHSLAGGSAVLAALTGEGLLAVEGGCVRPTRRGLLQADRFPRCFSERPGRG